MFFIFFILIEHTVSREDPDQMPHHAASDLGLQGLTMSHQKGC